MQTHLCQGYITYYFLFVQQNLNIKNVYAQSIQLHAISPKKKFTYVRQLWEYFKRKESKMYV